MKKVNAIVPVNEYSEIVEKAFVKCLSADCTLSSLNSDRYVILPGFCDVHVHFREPGFFYKESIKTGSMAAAHGGYTDVCTMPNLKPVPDNYTNLSIQLSVIDIESKINVYPYGSITVGQRGEKLSDMDSMSKFVIGFSDDGRGVQKQEMMKEAMLKAKSLGKIISAHCEENSLLNGGYIHLGNYASQHNHKGICSESEWKPIERDIELCKETGCAYHVCHISCKESVELIRKAKKDGVNITCETGPHYLLLDENNLQEDGRFKMNPPLRGTEDRLALIEGLKDGTVDMIATDHAPHSKEEKSKGLAGSAFGITGLETAFPVLYTGLVKTGVITLEKLVELLAVNPRKRFEIEMGNNFSVWDLESCNKIDPSEFLSKGKATPFEGMECYGKCLYTVCNGKSVYRNF